ncbi:MAG: type I glutamate--ammonia ligase [Candidatus Asgardarchaeia archaeon]
MLKSIKWVEFWATNILGKVRSVTLPVKDGKLPDMVGFDGSSLGFAPINSSDMVLVPDVSTLKVIPWSSKDHLSAMVICDVYEAVGDNRFLGDPRYVSDIVEEEVKKAGFSKALIAPEMEFFVFDGIKKLEGSINVFEKNLMTVDISSEETKMESGKYYIEAKDGYFQPTPFDRTHEYRIELCERIMEMGLNITKTHHEVATSGQVEVVLNAGGVKNSADNVQVFKNVARNIAYRMGLICTFMPKPIPFDNGSGMHLHVSLWKDDQNVFYDKDDDYAEISQTCRYFIGGILEHGRALSAIVAPTINSYKRLKPHYEAPVYLCWGKENRSALIRIPYYTKGEEWGKRRRIEVRFPDPTCNPYLAFSAIVAAGLDGIKNKIDPGDPIDSSVYSMGESELKRMGIDSLPGSLEEALDEMESDELMERVLGSYIMERYLDAKREEIREFRDQVTLWEYLKYLNY